MKTKLLLPLSLLLFFSACRYSDGPKLSFRSAKNRITNTWVIAKYSDNGNDQTENFNKLFPEYTLEIRTDDKYTLTSKGIVPFNETGKWEFLDGGKKLNLKKDGTETNEWNISRLTKDEFWANQTDKDGHLIEYRLKSK